MNKTLPTSKDVADFIRDLPSEKRQAEALQLVDMFKEVTGHAPKMWGPSIIGFDQYHYKYASGNEGDMPSVSFSPRKGAISLYLFDGYTEYADLLSKLGKHKKAVACLYVNKLADIEMTVLKDMVAKSYAAVDNHPDRVDK